MINSHWAVTGWMDDFGYVIRRPGVASLDLMIHSLTCFFIN